MHTCGNTFLSGTTTWPKKSSVKNASRFHTSIFKWDRLHCATATGNAKSLRHSGEVVVSPQQRVSTTSRGG